MTDETFVSSEGVEVSYLRRRHGSDTLVIWFSAFTRGPHLGRVLKVTPGFHGYKFSKSHDEFDWLLVRDSWGYTQDGTYYGGRAGDLFVERAVSECVQHFVEEQRRMNPRSVVVAMGSSMGAFAAIKFGVLHGIPAFGWSPHLDVEIAMKYCGRGPWVRFCLENASEADQVAYLERMKDVVDAHQTALPRLILQVAEDDPFVYPEQVTPFVDRYRSHGGSVQLDLRERGGHSSIHVPDEYIVSALRSLAAEHVLDLAAMRLLPSRKLSFRERFERFLQSIEGLVLRLLRIIGLRR